MVAEKQHWRALQAAVRGNAVEFFLLAALASLERGVRPVAKFRSRVLSCKVVFLPNEKLQEPVRHRGIFRAHFRIVFSPAFARVGPRHACILPLSLFKLWRALIFACKGFSRAFFRMRSEGC